MLDGIISNMKKTQPSDGRTRAEILASIANLPDSVQGSISSYTVTTSSGKTITYHKLQYWADGRNHAVHIPKEKLPDFEAAVENGRRLRELLAELTEATARDMLSSDPPLKKPRRDRAQGRGRADRAGGTRGGQHRAGRHRMHEPA